MIVAAQDVSGPELVVRTSPAIPTAGSPWVLTFLVNHPVPAEVVIMAPPFTGSLFLEQALKGPRLQEAASPDESAAQWTVAEYRFMLNSPGIITLDPFTVITPLGRTVTAPLTLNVQRARGGQETLRPRLVWDGVPPRVTAGESVVFGLRINGWDSRPLPAAEILMPAVPQGVILESLEPAPDEKAAGLALKLRLIPLDVAVFSLPARTVTYGSAVLEVPSLRITVNAALPGAVPAAMQVSPLMREFSGTAETAFAGVPPGEAVAGKASALFPGLDPAVRSHPLLFKTFRGDCESIYNTARNLWERGYRAEALAELRRNERKHPAGLLFLQVRREAERELGLLNTADESRRPKKLLFCAIPAFFAFALLCLWFMRSPRKRKAAALLCAALFAAVGIICLYWFLYPQWAEDPRFGGFFRQPHFGVTKATEVYRVPDAAGEAVFSFSEGQSVRLPGGKTAAGSPSWVWVETNDAKAETGWIPAEAIIFY
ncbi:hypothetical protein AGMMS50293_09710 [Spirochaetia bacterium]|nr:hypothetical protein AGMMS50293_09710 [Spirochaetia bacterium]